jgi:hypothetical protein
MKKRNELISCLESHERPRKHSGCAAVTDTDVSPGSASPAAPTDISRPPAPLNPVWALLGVTGYHP